LTQQGPTLSFDQQFKKFTAIQPLSESLYFAIDTVRGKGNKYYWRFCWSCLL